MSNYTERQWQEESRRYRAEQRVIFALALLAAALLAVPAVLIVQALWRLV